MLELGPFILPTTSPEAAEESSAIALEHEVTRLIHGSAAEREAALIALRNGGPAAVDLLARALIAQAEVCTALARTVRPASPNSANADPLSRSAPRVAPPQSRIAPPERSGPTEATFLERLLQDGTVEVRLATVLALGNAPRPRALSLLALAIQDGDPRVAAAAAQALGAMGPPARNALAAALRNASCEVRALLPGALARLGDAASLSLVCFALLDPDPEVRAAAFDAVGALHYPQSVAAMEMALSEPDPSVGVATFQAFEAGGHDCVPPLIDALVSSSGELSIRAATVIAQLAKDTPDRRLLAASGPLRRLQGWRIVGTDCDRAVYREAFQEVERLREKLSFPLPAEPSNGSKQLPIVAEGPMPNASDLPTPSSGDS